MKQSEKINKPAVINFVLFFAVLVGMHGCTSYNQPKAASDYQVNSRAMPEKRLKVKYLEFMSVGDTGTGGIGQAFVADAMSEYAAKHPAEFVLMLGDNFYSNGVESVNDSQWGLKFRYMYHHSSLQIPFYAVLGNHDHYGNPDAQVDYTDMPGNWRWRMPSRYYSFKKSVDESTEIQFIALDTTPIAYARQSSLEQIKWLEEQLENSDAEWKFVFGHHPLYSGGIYGNNETMKKMLEHIFVKYKVDMYLSGHDHDQQLLGPVEGVHYIVNGTGSYERDVSWMRNTVYAGNDPGFVWFRVSRDELVAAFISANGVLQYAHNIAR